MGKKKTDNSLFSSDFDGLSGERYVFSFEKPTAKTNGKSDPLSFGGGFNGKSDPLSFGGGSNGKSDPLSFLNSGAGGGGGDTEGDRTSETGSDSGETSDSDGGGWPSAPPADYLEHVTGYEMVSFDTVSVPPPIVPPEETEPSGESGDGTSPSAEETTAVVAPPLISQLTQQQARSALLTHVASRCCYGSTAAKQMHITKMDYVPAYHYELQTFTEKRETSWTYAPHRGGEVDSPARGPAPLPWEVDESPGAMFRDEVRLVPVPRTTVVKACHKCRGTGGMTCRECSGKGYVRCLHCHGAVHLSDAGSMGRDRCYYCQHSKYGHGQMDCGKCGAKGKVSCGTCEGTAHIRCYIQLSITWRVNTAEHIVEKLNIPEELIRDVSGQVAFEEEKPVVDPVDAFNDDVIKAASTQLVTSHANAFLDQKILRQRHQVRIVPVTKVTYVWKGRNRVFFVYGYENKVHLPGSSYPQTCCWGCQIM